MGTVMEKIKKINQKREKTNDSCSAIIYCKLTEISNILRSGFHEF
jgi:hypothetical protein